jgi:hypothetical protein
VSHEYKIKIVAANPFRNDGGPDCKLIRVSFRLGQERSTKITRTITKKAKLFSFILETGEHACQFTTPG